MSRSQGPTDERIHAGFLRLTGFNFRGIRRSIVSEISVLDSDSTSKLALLSFCTAGASPEIAPSHLRSSSAASAFVFGAFCLFFGQNLHW